MTPYKLHLLQHLKDTDKTARKNFCTQMEAMLEQDGFDDRLVFSDEAIFSLTGKVYKHNTHIRNWTSSFNAGVCARIS